MAALLMTTIVLKQMCLVNKSPPASPICLSGTGSGKTSSHGGEGSICERCPDLWSWTLETYLAQKFQNQIKTLNLCLCFRSCKMGALCTDFLMLKNTVQMQVNYSVTTWMLPGGWLIMGIWWILCVRHNIFISFPLWNSL